MLMDDGKDVPPVVVANNDGLDLFVEMRSEVPELNLCVTVLDENQGEGSIDPTKERADIALEALEMKKENRISDFLCDNGSNCSDSSDSLEDDDSFWHEFAQAEEKAATTPSNTQATPSLWDMMNKGKGVVYDLEGESSEQSICGTSSRAVLEGAHADEEDFSAMFGMDAPPVVDNVAEDRLDNALAEVDYEGDGVFVGRIFRSKVDCKLKMAIHAINRKFHFRTARSTRTSMELVCVNSNCQWRVYASVMDGSGSFQIKKANFVQTCPIDYRHLYHRQATTQVIGELIRSRFVPGRKGSGLAEIQRIMHVESRLQKQYEYNRR